MPVGAATCPKCGKAAPRPCPKCSAPIENEKTKFCPECGESLIKTCGKCNTQIVGSPKFCPDCGNNLQGGNA
jgi:predicted RNA-binding Zn-ribbon protein involved in translation (DUF1610 family)